MHGLLVMLPAAAILVIVAVGTSQMWSWPYLRWTQTSAQWHQQSTWPAAVAGAAAAWWAVRLYSADRVWVQPQARRLGAPVVVRHLGMLLAWYVGAYVLGLLPLTIITAATGIGSPDVLVMVSGMLAMTAATALGYALGTLVSTTAIVPITALLMVALDALSAYGSDQFAALTPTLYRNPVLGEAESSALLIFRTTFFLLVTGMAGVLVTLVLRWRSRGHTSTLVRTGGIAACLLPAVVLAALALSARPMLYVAEASADKTCRDVRGIDYCVHVDNAPRLGDMIATIQATLARYGAQPTRFHTVWDYTLLLDQPLTGTTIDGRLTAILEPDGSISVDGLELALLPIDRCPSDTLDEGVTISTYIALSEYLRTGHTTGDFADLTPAQTRQWIRQHQHHIDTCGLTAHDLPNT